MSQSKIESLKLVPEENRERDAAYGAISVSIPEIVNAPDDPMPNNCNEVRWNVQELKVDPYAKNYVKLLDWRMIAGRVYKQASHEPNLNRIVCYQQSNEPN